jgi:hypothetical protein
LEPLLRALTKIADRWKQVIDQKRYPLQPLHIQLSLKNPSVIVETYPVLAHKAYISEFPNLMQKLLLLLWEKQLLNELSRVRFFAETIDTVKVLGYRDNRPYCYIDLETRQVILIDNSSYPEVGTVEDWIMGQVKLGEIMTELVKRHEASKLKVTNKS